MKSRTVSRREFLERSVAGTAAALLPGSLAASEKKATAVDLVPLGKTGYKICRLGLGTGSHGGKVQRDLGQKSFERLVHHAYEKGIRFIDTADAYRTHEMVGKAIKTLPREKLWIQSKMRWEPDARKEGTQKALERFLRELGTDYIDSLLIHCTRMKTWPDDLKDMMDALSEAKDRKLIRTHGVSCHGLPGLRGSTGCAWVDVQLARCNPQGRHVDGRTGNWGEPGRTQDAFKELEEMHRKGRGVIGMKIIGNGDFKDAKDREKSIRFAMGCGFLDAVVIGFASPAEVDEAIRRMNEALNA